MTLAKTQYIQNDNERYSSEELFYSQLTREEKIEYNDIMIRHLKGCQEYYRGQIYLNNFQREKNYPDKQLYKDFSYYQYPSWDNVVLINKDIEDLELKNKILKLKGIDEQEV